MGKHTLRRLVWVNNSFYVTLYYSMRKAFLKEFIFGLILVCFAYS